MQAGSAQGAELCCGSCGDASRASFRGTGGGGWGIIVILSNRDAVQLIGMLPALLVAHNGEWLRHYPDQHGAVETSVRFVAWRHHNAVRTTKMLKPV